MMGAIRIEYRLSQTLSTNSWTFNIFITIVHTQNQIKGHIGFRKLYIYVYTNTIVLEQHDYDVLKHRDNKIKW